MDTDSLCIEEILVYIHGVLQARSIQPLAVNYLISNRHKIVKAALFNARLEKEMKPTKNRVFCRDCRRTKMLFETEKKANNFIAFNQEEIEAETGIAPQRSYFCIFCAGWHVTSIKEEIGISKNEKLLEEYLNDKASKKEKAVQNEKEKIVPEKTKIDNEERRNRLKLELENEINSMDVNQIETFFSEKIDFLKSQIENLNNRTNNFEKEELKELRLNLEIVYIVRKQNGFRKTSKPSEKSRERDLEEWRIWIEKQGYDKE